MISSDHFTMVNSHHLLPPELWLKIFSFTSPFDLFSSISSSCSYFNRLIAFNQGSLPQIRVTLRAWVQDDKEKAIDNSLDSSITYVISVNDQTKTAMSAGHSNCPRRIDRRMKMIFVSFSGRKVKSELENREGNIENMEEHVLVRLLSWMEVTCLIVEVRKGGVKRYCKRSDETLPLIIQWAVNNFGSVNIKNMFLSSHNSSFEWCPNEKSIEMMESLSLESLTIENMPSLRILSSPSFVPSIILRMSHTHKMITNRLRFYTMSGEYFHTLLHASSPIYHNLFSEVPSLISMVTAADLAEFILLWRSSPSPVLIICLSFNSIISLSDFRSIFPSKGLDRILEEIPYCRYRSAHSLHPNIGLELTCYGNGFSTQWQMRSAEMRLLV